MESVSGTAGDFDDHFIQLYRYFMTLVTLVRQIMSHQESDDDSWSLSH